LGSASRSLFSSLACRGRESCASSWRRRGRSNRQRFRQNRAPFQERLHGNGIRRADGVDERPDSAIGWKSLGAIPGTPVHDRPQTVGACVQTISTASPQFAPVAAARCALWRSLDGKVRGRARDNPRKAIAAPRTVRVAEKMWFHPPSKFSEEPLPVLRFRLTPPCIFKGAVPKLTWAWITDHTGLNRQVLIHTSLLFLFNS